MRLAAAFLIAALGWGQPVKDRTIWYAVDARPAYKRCGGENLRQWNCAEAFNGDWRVLDKIPKQPCVLGDGFVLHRQDPQWELFYLCVSLRSMEKAPASKPRGYIGNDHPGHKQ